MQPGETKCSSRIRCHHLLKTFWNDGVHDGPHQHDGGGWGANLDNDNASTFAVALARDLELGPQVENRNNFAPKIDDAFDVIRHPGDRRYGTQPDDLADAKDRQPVGLQAQLKG